MDKNIRRPKVSVLMPVFNGEKYLREAIESILNQDFENFEFIIINDGSTDTSSSIISSYSDNRIVVVNNEKNSGLVTTLNKGLELAIGEYIVRMDCDDVSVTKRLSKQVKMMDTNQNIGASGSFFYMIRNNKKAIADFPISNEEIKCFMIFNSPIAHPSSIIRSEVLKKYKLNYSTEYTHSEDYDFWSKISEHSQLANIPEPLLNYRVHENQITGNPKFVALKNNTLDKIRLRHLKTLGIIPTDKELNLHNLISNAQKPTDSIQLSLAETWLMKLMTVNNHTKILNKPYFEKIILERWLRLCINFYGLKNGFSYFYKSKIYKIIKLPLSLKIELYKQLYYSYKRKS